MDRYSDDIESLPLNNLYVPNSNEKAIVESLFGGSKSSMNNNLINEIKDLVLIAILFVIFSLKNVDELVEKFIPASQNSVYILLMVKTLGMVTLFWIIKNFYLSQRD